MSKTNLGLVEYAKGQLGRPYWYGTFGQLSSVELYRAKKDQYGSKLTGTEASYLEQARQHVKVHDCAGLIKGYMYSETPNSPAEYLPKYDLSANQLIKACTVQGAYSSIPEIQGLMVWKSGHAGVYIGGGRVIEAKGHAYGVVQTTDTKWEKWGQIPWLEYVSPQTNTDLVSIDLPVCRKGTKDPVVKRIQLVLNYLGIKGKDGLVLSVDGSFGGNTEFGVSTFQRKYGLPVTGICDRATWIALLTK